LAAGVANTLFAEVLTQARNCVLLSSEHFSVDGTLSQAWAGHKSFKRKDGSDFQDMRDQQVTPHLALKASTIIDPRTTRHHQAGRHPSKTGQPAITNSEPYAA